MKLLLTFAALVFSLSSFASERAFISYAGMESWGRSFYACTYAESQTIKHLKTLGATNIDVTCSGGIDIWMQGPVRIVAEFDVPAPTGRDEARRMTITGNRRNPSCGLNVAIFKAILPKFSKTISVTSADDACLSRTSNYSYDLLVDM
ncbi:hypothetical protein [Peredibacter starrii]|uniref:Uncharacterized protein n=1 Tax=Peredibacter starrii TaxID=28202 RepID=A0AAX4HJQ2_9BACT|nr:hypothetical protein [Peredibacter starrii]WPU63460.1 hypothetical protein SOO65_12250 [Peredibacter starrii]